MNTETKQKISGFVQLIAVILFIGAALAISVILQSNKKTIQNGQKVERVLFVEAQSFTPAPYAITLSTTGTVESRATVDVVSQVSGRIISVNDNFYGGGYFTAGETLFQIDPRDYELTVERLEAELARAKTTLEIEQAESAAALEEWKMLNGSKVAPDLVLRKPQQKEAAANLKAAEAQLADAKLDLERTTFSLPFTGRVLSSNVSLGQFITAGQSYGSVFDTASLEIRSTIEEESLKFLHPIEDLAINVKTKHMGQDRTYSAFIKRSAASLDTQTRFAPLIFGFKDDANDLLPGTFVAVEITTAETNEVLAIPSTARQKDGRIWMVNADNTVSPLEGYTILHNNGDTLALSGITETVRLVTSSLPGAIDGMKVDIREARK